jgi:hypothetical protein
MISPRGLWRIPAYQRSSLLALRTLNSFYETLRTFVRSDPYTFTVALEASRRGNDQDGRHYPIAVSAKDNLGNPGFKTATVTVPHG